MAACGPSDHDFRRALAECRFPSRGLRPGLVPFSARCVARHLAADTGIDLDAAMADLERWARNLGGDVVEGEVLWLPADRFGGPPSETPPELSGRDALERDAVTLQAGDPVRLTQAAGGMAAGSEGVLIGWYAGELWVALVKFFDGGLVKVPVHLIVKAELAAPEPPVRLGV